MLYSAIIWISYFSVHYARGVSIYIQNAGFESTTGFSKIPIPSNTYYYKKGTIIDKWDLYDPDNVAPDYAEGVYNPSGSTLFADPQFGNLNPEGTVCAYLEQDDNKKTGQGELGIEQTLSTAIKAETEYTLSVYVGNDDYNCFSKDSTGADAKDNCYDNDGFPGYRVQLLAGNNIVAEDDNSISIPEGYWALSTVVYTTDASVDETLTLGIRLISKNVVKGVISLDDVQLKAESITTTTTTTTSTTTTTEAPTTTTTTTKEVDPITTAITTTTVASTTTTKAATTSATTSNTATTTEGGDDDDQGDDNNDQGDDNNDQGEDNNQEDDSETQDDEDAVQMGADKGLVQYISVESLLGIGVMVAIMSCLCPCMICVFCKLFKWDKDDDKGAPREVEKRVEVNVELDDKHFKIQHWFENDVGLGHYGSIFIANGYDSLPAIMAIHDAEQLDDIGVTLHSHQQRILCEVRKLMAKNKTPDGRDGPTDTTDTTHKVYGPDKVIEIKAGNENHYGLQGGYGNNNMHYGGNMMQHQMINNQFMNSHNIVYDSE